MTTTFFGIPVSGDITRSEKRAEQRPVEEFAPLLQAVLDDPTIVELGWTQYTPYFNDGDPCVFTTHSPWVRTEADDLDADRYDLEFYYSHPTLGERWGEWVGGKYVPGAYKGVDEERYDRCRSLGGALDSGAFEDALLEAFGDHAEIKVARDGIHVEFYEHD